MSINYTPRTWVAAEVVTAAEMNTEIRDAFVGIQAAWTAYTPALTASTTNPTMGSGSTAAGSYTRTGKTVMGSAEIVAGTSGFAAGSGTYRVSLPVAGIASATTSGRMVGEGVFFDASTSTFYHVMLSAVSATTAAMVLTSAGAMTAAAPVVSANTDQWRYKFEYEAA